MFNSSRTLFPAYSGLDEIDVAMPNAPSRNVAMRTTSELWKIHNSEPHVTAPAEPGISVPYPDNGFDPNGLSETNEANTLINRASVGLDRDEFSDLCQQLDDIYTKRLVSDLNLSSMNVGELKEHISNECVGALLIYNESDKDKLIKAFSLCKSLDSLTEKVLEKAQFPEQEKQKLLSFVNCCQAVRDAMLLPDYQIRQTILGSTISRDSLDTALSFYGLNEESVAMRLNPNDEFKDYKEAIILCECELSQACNLEISSGVVAKALNNCLSQVLGKVISPELKVALSSVVEHVQSRSLKDAKKSAKQSKELLQKLKSEMIKVGVTPSMTQKLNQKLSTSDSVLNIQGTGVSIDVHNANNAKRNPQEIQNTLQSLKSAQSQLTHILNTQNLNPIARLCVTCELYTVMCLQDCCVALSLGDDKLRECAGNLKSALFEEVKNSNIGNIESLNNNVNNAHKDLHSAESSKTMEYLKKAQSENVISDKKLQTLTRLLG
tara:strand:- start:3032 stop:4510 length:1479 start_codon:yes stop_codon:yes gene_type:complete